MTPHLYAIISFIILAISIPGQTQERPQTARIINVAVAGSGCDSQATSVVISPDLRDLSLMFSDYGVEIGKGSLNPQVRTLQKDCRILVDIAIPAGWSFAFDYVDYRGFAALPKGTWGFHRMSYITSLREISSAKEVTLQGPYNDIYTMRSNQKPERIPWTPCNSTVQRIELLSQLAVNLYPQFPIGDIAQIALDSADFSSRQNFGVKWRKCSGGSTNPPPRPGGPRPPGPIRPGPR